MKKSRLYTKTGDKGMTALVGGTRVPKTHLRLEAYGTVDELNCYVGWLREEVQEAEHQVFLQFIQNELFMVGSYLATETEKGEPKRVGTITGKEIERVEREIDRIDHILPKLSRFVLPGGSEAAARAHICRAVARRAERNTHRVAEEYPVEQEVLTFLNRLSDYFFVFARFESNKLSEEIYWEQGNI
ncbi:MAG: cob(I)yrinic acid a,c-diamide adenosyltransferase [Bacteroidota bacterium]|nr:cob(I)yrinic acid a,c-diamide adenosyltransferase [Bacteroidota bacterium]